jgi:glycosyltransferase involved in cell wall biosynthesis
MVLCQAWAAGLPLLTTTNCGGPDLIADGAPGWAVPIRCPEAMADRLSWSDEHRHELAAMTEQIPAKRHALDWSQTAREFEDNAVHLLARPS